MKFGSVCSGIEAASGAWKPLGWHPAWYAEIAAFPNAVLAHRHPETPNLGDMTALRDRRAELGSIDVLVGGTPCQSFSVAGLRKGLDDPRGNLALVFLGLVDAMGAEWVVWENVPGVLSTDGWRAFGAFLGALGELGYGWAYRILDAQYFGLAQRRKRVFVVANLGGWQRAAAVLFERTCLSGDSPPRRETGKDLAPSLSSRPTGGGGPGTDFDLDGGLIPQVSLSLASKGGTGRHDPSQESYIVHTLSAEGADASPDAGRGYPIVVGGGSNPVVSEKMPALTGRKGDRTAIAFSCKDSGADAAAELAPTLRAMGHDRSHANGGGHVAALGQFGVRRLTPREWERLQGFPDDYTLIPYGRKGQLAKDGPRYKAIGNSMPVPVMQWIGRRIETVERIVPQVAAGFIRASEGVGPC